MKPLISIIVLTYNQEHTVNRTLDSILNQNTTYSYEVIIGEDCSSDGTRPICEKYVEKYPEKVCLMPAQANKGLMKNYRDCIEVCQGKYLAVCAGDDWWHSENKLQVQVDYLERNENCVLVFTNYDVFNAKTGKIIKNALPIASFDTSHIIDKLMRGFFLPSLTIMYRREALQYIDFDFFLERAYRAEDLPMFLKFALYGTLDCINVSTATYTAQAGSLSHFDDAPKMESFLINMLQIKLDFLIAHPEASTVTKQELIEIYNRIIFSGSFTLQHRQQALRVGAKLSKKSVKEHVKWIICKWSSLFELYCKLK